MFPQMGSVMFNWSDAVQMKIIQKVAVDFESQENVLAVVTVDMMLQVMKSRDVDRKPEGERQWRWFSGWSTTEVKPDTVLQDPNGIQFRVTAVDDWGQAGFWKCDLAQQPIG